MQWGQGERFREETTHKKRGSFMEWRGTQRQIGASKGTGQVQLEIGELVLFCFSFFDLLLVIDFFFFFQSYSEMPTQIISVFNQLIHLAGRVLPCASV